MATGTSRRKDPGDGPPTVAGQAERPAPTAPSFGICEGVRTDLEQVKETTDPFTGKVVTREDVK